MAKFTVTNPDVENRQFTLMTDQSSGLTVGLDELQQYFDAHAGDLTRPFALRMVANRLKAAGITSVNEDTDPMAVSAAIGAIRGVVQTQDFDQV